MTRYRENEFKKELMRNLEAFDDVINLLDEAKRKSTSKAAHKVLDSILSIISTRRIESIKIIQPLNKS